MTMQLQSFDEISRSFHKEVLEEIRLLNLQIERSRQFRGAAEARGLPQKSEGGVPIAAAPIKVPSLPLATAVLTLDQRIDEQLKLDNKEGFLMNLGKKGFMGRQSWAKTWVVVAPNDIKWFGAKGESKPLDSIPLYVETTNTRGSKFKNPAVCFPFITTNECPKATEAGKFYFGVQYYDKDKLEFLVFQAETDAERLEWVAFLTKYVKMYIPPGMSVQSPRVGSETPLHTKTVLGGEAPK